MYFVFHYCFRFVLLFIFKTPQYHMTFSSADFLNISTEIIVIKSLFHVCMYVTLSLLNLQWLMTNAVFPCQNEGVHNESLSMRFSGTENDLNHILSTFEDSEDLIKTFSTSHYIAMTDIQSIFQNRQSDFVIATLNIQSINAKFDNLYAIVNNLSAS